MRFVGLVCLFWVDDIWLFGFLDFWWEGRISGGLLEGVGDFFWFDFCLGVLVFVEWFFVFGIVIVLFYRWCEYLCFMDKNKVMLVIYIIIWYRIK